MTRGKQKNYRVLILYLFVFIISISIVFKIFKIQSLTAQINTSSQPKYFKIPAPRGNIIADDGSLLAVSMPLYDVRLDLSVINDSIFNNNIKELSENLALFFLDKSPKEYEQLLRKNKNDNNKYMSLKKKITYNELNHMKTMPILKLGQYKGGMIIEERRNREKPFGLLASRTVGEIREVNPIGIERAFNKTLTGEDGLHLKRKIGKNIWVPQDDYKNKLPVAGKNIITTINIDMQDVAQQILKSSLIKLDASWGCVVLMEVKTGHIKVISNLKNEQDGQMSESFNYALAKHTAPGSTFKLASIIAGLEDGFFKIEDSVDINGGSYQYYDRLMMDSEKSNKRNITIASAFYTSSNIGISKIINENYKKTPEVFTDRIYRMGLSTPLDLEIPFPNNLIFPAPNKGGWSGVTLPWMSIGYEMQLSPIHILTFYNAIANNGKMILPIFTSAISADGHTIQERFSNTIRSSICSKSTLKTVIPLLKKVVSQGTARNIYSKKFSIAGKTGTTVLNYSDRAEGESKKYQASFVGFFPADNPKYSGIVVVSDPKRKFYGGAVAAPIFRELADKVYSSDMDIHNSINDEREYFDLPTAIKGKKQDINIVLDELSIEKNKKHNNGWTSLKIEDKSIHYMQSAVEHKLIKGIMPDLRGMSLKDASYLLDKYHIDYIVNGSGIIKKQSIKIGRKIDLNEKLKIELS
tara:strand:- start:85 stop:2169 length:2085 start_codon:yes stop_codon:yes gene_type:complete